MPAASAASAASPLFAAFDEPPQPAAAATTTADTANALRRRTLHPVTIVLSPHDQVSGDAISRHGYTNAEIPVSARPMTRLWISLVPS
ncbi:hypothetical protein GCM10009838_75110 [Catenulispora subtropica]|uniref:Uncharacterized protein n=1 Tax=Catenulispora subtropica TaxID=450798 RepID=A0ABN2T4R6_9ACTN